MLCPNCDCEGRSEVLESRSTRHFTRRRRCCTLCGKRYTTYEYTKAFFENYVSNYESFLTKLNAHIEGLVPHV